MAGGVPGNRDKIGTCLHCASNRSLAALRIHRIPTVGFGEGPSRGGAGEGERLGRSRRGEGSYVKNNHLRQVQIPEPETKYGSRTLYQDNHHRIQNLQMLSCQRVVRTY